MQIRPITPSFKGYIEISACPVNYNKYEPTTINTNSIIVTNANVDERGYKSLGITHISNGGEAYVTSCPYDLVQKACILADQHKDSIVSIDSEYNILVKKQPVQEFGDK